MGSVLQDEMESELGNMCRKERDGQFRDWGSGSVTLAFPEAAAAKAVSSQLLHSSFTFGKPNPAHQ